MTISDVMINDVILYSRLALLNDEYRNNDMINDVKINQTRTKRLLIVHHP